MNYHGFAASLLDRYGVLAGFEPGARVLNQAQREEICGRVLDRMTFEHTRPPRSSPRWSRKILELDDQLQNHRVAPIDAIAWLTDRLETLKNHRSDRVVPRGAGADRADRGGDRVPRAEGGARRDRLTATRSTAPSRSSRALPGRGRRPPRSVPGGAAGRVPGHERRAGGADVRRSSATATRSPRSATPTRTSTRGGARRSTTCSEFPTDFPGTDGTAAARLPLYTNFRSGARILAAADTVIAPAARGAASRPGKRLVPWAANGQGEVRVRRVPDEWTEAGAIADRCVELHGDGVALVGDARCSVARRRLFGLLQPGLRRARACRSRSSGSRGC